MILVEINFGRSRSIQKLEAEDIAENYLAALNRAGQLGDEYFLSWNKGELICDTLMMGTSANTMRFHSDWGKAALKKVVNAFARKPDWKIRDDEVSKRNVSWKAPTLHLFTHALDRTTPVRRGDTGKAVPTFLLPLEFQLKEDIGRWQSEYVLFDRLWLNSGTLEMSAYKELVDLASKLSGEGRELCAAIEKATSVPTYYFLMRYYATEPGDDDRPCPGCGKSWHLPQPLNAPFHHWAFVCKNCRLVSKAGVEINRRHAKIGLWKPFL
jgi:predicted  nucleic acid-binding Zn ribbon protein